MTTPPLVPSGSPTTTQLIEAMLFRGGASLTAERAAEAIRGLHPAEFLEAIHQLSRDYRRQGRPYAIQFEQNGFVVKLSSGFKSVEERLYGLNRQARLSAA